MGAGSGNNVYADRQSRGSYNSGSQAEQIRNTLPVNSGSTHAYASSRNEYGHNVTRAGFGGAPAEGDDRGRGFGQKAGNVLGSVFGAIFKPINAVGNFGVNTLRGIEDATGMKNLGVGYQQNPGLNFGRNASNVSFSGSYNSNNRNSRQSGERGYNVGSKASENHGQFIPQKSGSFQHDGQNGYKLFDGVTDLTALKNFDSGKDLLSAYKLVNSDHKNQAELLEKHIENTGSARGFSKNPDQLMREDMVEAAMNALYNNAGSYTTALKTDAVEFKQEINAWNTNLNLSHIRDKETLDTAMTAINTAFRSDQKAGSAKYSKELYEILQNQRGTVLKTALENFADPARRAVKLLVDTAAEKTLHANISRMEFDTASGKTAKDVFMTNQDIWAGKAGILTDDKGDEGRFGLFVKDGQPVLRMMYDGKTVETIVPASRLEYTIKEIAKVSNGDTKQDNTFEGTHKNIIAIAKTYGSSSARFRQDVMDAVDHADAAKAATAQAKIEAEAEVKPLVEARDTAKSGVDGIRQEITEAQKDMQGLKKAELVANDKINDLSLQLTKLEANGKKLKADYKEERGTNGDTDKASSLYKDMLATGGQLNDLKIEHREVKKDHTEIIAKLETGEKSIEALEGRLQPKLELLKLAETDLTEAKSKFAALNAPKEEEKVAGGGAAVAYDHTKLSDQQIEKAADGIIDALLTNPAIEKLSKPNMIGLTLFNTEAKKAETIEKIKSGVRPEEALESMNRNLSMLKITLSDEQKEALANAVDNLGVDIRGMLNAQDTRQTSIDSIDPMTIQSAGQVRQV